jgi:protein-S-isoprenylcysteine O-methyltransferase Ste14
MGGGVDFTTSTQLGVLHCLLHQCLPVLLAKTSGFDFFPTPFVPYPLRFLDVLATVLLLLAAVMQHYSELERYLFKKQDCNYGRLHTEGFFGMARFINHTGTYNLSFAQPNPIIFLTIRLNMIFFVLLLIPPTFISQPPGHSLTDLCNAVLCRSPCYFLFPGVVTFVMLLRDIIPDTEKHLRAKYKDQYEKYEKLTPYLLLPGVY